MIVEPLISFIHTTPSMIFEPGLFKIFVSSLLSNTLCSNVCAILIASVGQASIHSCTWYTVPGDTQICQSLFSFCLPVSVSNLVMILMVPFGQASSQAVQPVQRCSLFSSCGITTSPLNRSGNFNVSLLSGYCWVMISL